MKKEPFKITIESYGNKYSIEKEYSDVSMEELWGLMQQVCLCAGYHPNTVKEYFKEDE